MSCSNLNTKNSTDVNNAVQRRCVLLVGNFLSATLGVRGVCEDLAIQLEKSRWTVITTSNKAGRVMRLLDMVSTVWRNRHVYVVANVEVYSGLAFSWAEVVCKILRGIGKPYVLTLHGGNLPSFARRWPRRVRRLLCTAEVVFAPSRYLHEQMTPYRTDLSLVPNPIDISLYQFRLRLEPRPVLIWLRAFHSIYNPSLAPKVLWHLEKDFPDIRLIMIGTDRQDGSLAEMRTVAKRLGVIDRISTPGKIDKSEVAAWMDMGDIFLNTTNADNTPITVLEAMACGLCIVSTDVGGIPYLIEHEHNALLVPPNDPVAMAGAVRRILKETGQARKLSANGRRKAELFDWSVVLPKWESLLSAVRNGV